MVPVSSPRWADARGPELRGSIEIQGLECHQIRVCFNGKPLADCVFANEATETAVIIARAEDGRYLSTRHPEEWQHRSDIYTVEDCPVVYQVLHGAFRSLVYQELHGAVRIDLPKHARA